jgi:SAM-dependent methyltransferase
MIWRLLRLLYRIALNVDTESKAISRQVMNALRNSPDKKILDVGCGFGRNISMLTKLGLDVTGVEVNPDIVKVNRLAGFNCYSTKEFEASTERYGLILMSHVVEHFSPADLVTFIDSYLDRLHPGGYLLIATPLSSSNFYDDFDHVRPYQPIGLLMVFGGENAQVQYYARTKLELCDVWFRRGPWRGNHFRARYIRSPATRLLQVSDFIAALAFRGSFGLIGRTDGWVGLFRKVA